MLHLLGNLLRTVVTLPKAAAINARNAVGLMKSGHTPLGASARRSLNMPHGGTSQQYDLNELRKRLSTPYPSQQQIGAEQARISRHNQQIDNDNQRKPLQSIAEGAKSGFKVAGFVGALIGAEKALVALAKASSDAATEQLKMYSPHYARIAAEKQRAEMQYAARRGQLTSESAGSLSRSLIKMQKEWQPYSTMAENLKNRVFEFGVDFATGVEKALDAVGLTDAIKKWNDENRPNAQNPLLTWVDQKLAGKWPNQPAPLSSRPNERAGDRM